MARRGIGLVSHKTVVRLLGVSKSLWPGRGVRAKRLPERRVVQRRENVSMFYATPRENGRLAPTTDGRRRQTEGDLKALRPGEAFAET